MNSAELSAWSPWTPLGVPLNPHVLAETLDGGQAFRWRVDPNGTWTGQWADQVAQLRLESDGTLVGRVPSGSTAGLEALRAYLRLDTDFAALADQLPWRTDAHLAACLAAFPGLRLPRQPFGETLLCFLCSATKQIVQIKQMVALLAEKHGAPLPHADTGRHQLPTWAELAQIPEAALRGCLLGFRARYIKGTAAYLAARPGWLEETEHLPYPAAKARLMDLPGVGEKVADCVLLFGAGQLEAFPVDTWILKALARRYGLNGWTPAQVAQFGRAHFGNLAGLAQQYLFAWERDQPREFKR
ncbi:MAG: hypothetical protein RIS54_202 [Verrucomicrobiota bacterium]|jgi:N-glycosylase/DNA lyase